MERDFYTDEFEELIKQKADQFRMYPSDKVWKGIKRAMHSHKRRYWFGFVLLLTGLGYYAIDQLIISPPAKQASRSVLNPPSSDNQQAKILPFPQVTPDAPFNNKEKNDLIGHRPSTISSNNEDIAGTIQITRPTISGKPETYTATLEEFLRPTFVWDIDIVKAEDQAPTENDNMVPEQKEPGNQILVSEKLNEDGQQINWLQEYAVYELTPSKPKRINWQLSFAPTMNYRKLTGSKNANIQSDVKNAPIALNIQGDIDRLVNHKPALGFELGSFFLYTVNHNLSLKAGLQFNYSRYAIQAYSSPTEVATIALGGINGSNTDSISNYTRIRNFGGFAVKDLQNQYFQLSVPVGIELRILGNDKLQLGVAGTVQPTYLLNRNSYLITNDYRNYTKEPSLVRRWNVNTSAEAFVSYKTAGLKWQAGPQFRYQLFSSYSDKYPIKEFLMEYGVKIGVTKTIR